MNFIKKMFSPMQPNMTETAQYAARIARRHEPAFDLGEITQHATECVLVQSTPEKFDFVTGR